MDRSKVYKVYFNEDSNRWICEDEYMQQTGSYGLISGVDDFYTVCGAVADCANYEAWEVVNCLLDND